FILAKLERFQNLLQSALWKLDSGLKLPRYAMRLTQPLRLQTLCFVLAILPWPQSAVSQTTRYSPEGDQLPGPDCLNSVKPSSGQPKVCTADDFKLWLDDITHWRSEMRIRAGYAPENYERLEWKWTQSSFIQPQMMVEDRYFYDPFASSYTVDKYLDDLDRRYGGIDSVLLWPVYPNIGIDNRNQFDLLRDMPGGLPPLNKMVDDLPRRHVRVLFPNMPWDQGTRLEPRSFAETIAGLLAEIG